MLPVAPGLRSVYLRASYQFGRPSLRLIVVVRGIRLSRDWGLVCGHSYIVRHAEANPPYPAVYAVLWLARLVVVPLNVVSVALATTNVSPPVVFIPRDGTDEWSSAT